MKRWLSALLAFILCCSLCACGKKEVNPLVGVWEYKSTTRESSFTFTEEDDVLQGIYRYYDYAEKKWGEFAFTVKEQTDCSLTLLVDDGSLDQISYYLSGERIYLDGLIYTNATADVPTFESLGNISLLVNGKPFSIYKGLFMGMYIADIEAALDTKPEWQYRDDGTPSSTYLFPRDGIFYAVDLYLNQNQCLREIRCQGDYSEAVCASLIADLTSAFGSSEYRQYTYYPNGGDVAESVTDIRYWNTGNFEFEMRISTDIGADAPKYFTLSCRYTD